MLTKSLIVEELGERALLLPQMLARALTANGRLKFCFTVLQLAERHADDPHMELPSLLPERRAAGIDDPVIENGAANSRRDADGALFMPGAARLRELLIADASAMCAPLALIDDPAAAAFAERLKQLTGSLPAFDNDRVPAGTVAALTSADRGPGDSLHVLVMDLHRAVNDLQSRLSEEVIDGARAWRIAEDDRALIRAFMAGVNETAPLKFDHPGLGTTATRLGDRLVIQNDIGTTDAHVLVLHVEGLVATLTYTDVHANRLGFFQDLFKSFDVRWDDTRTRHDRNLAGAADYYLCSGRYEAADRNELSRYLSFLGSRIVFLIDWNRARKRLRQFLAKGDPVRLLKWAANHNCGHRGFLKLGGERLIFDAIEFAQQPPLHYGERLDEALGREGAFDYLKFVLDTAARSLLAGRSERFVRDEIRAELARRFRRAQEGILGVGVEHAVLVYELAITVQEALGTIGRGEDKAFLERSARRAVRWEQAADALVSRVRSLTRRMAKPGLFTALLHECDNAADELEEVAFLCTLLPGLRPGPELVDLLQQLSMQSVAAAQELVKMLEAAVHVDPDGPREDLEDALESGDRMVAIEHATDDLERDVTRLLLSSKADDCRVMALVEKVAHALEKAADAMARCALKLRDHLLHDILAGER